MGSTPQEHLQNLAVFLERSSQYGQGKCKTVREYSVFIIVINLQFRTYSIKELVMINYYLLALKNCGLKLLKIINVNN